MREQLEALGFKKSQPKQNKPNKPNGKPFNKFTKKPNHKLFKPKAAPVKKGPTNEEMIKSLDFNCMVYRLLARIENARRMNDETNEKLLVKLNKLNEGFKNDVKYITETYGQKSVVDKLSIHWNGFYTKLSNYLTNGDDTIQNESMYILSTSIDFVTIAIAEEIPLNNFMRTILIKCIPLINNVDNVGYVVGDAKVLHGIYTRKVIKGVYQ